MVKRPVTNPVTLRLPQPIAAQLKAHLFPGDGSEHGAVIGAAIVATNREYRLLGRRLFLAADGVDYVPGNFGNRMLTADFVRRCVLDCAKEGLAYLAVHNHGGDDRVGFSSIDTASHQRGYPALIDILNGPPAGGLVFARQAVAGSIWMATDHQVDLDHAVLVGRSHKLRYPSPKIPRDADPQFGRQVLLFGDRGQEILRTQKVGVVGAGGAGSLINEYLSRLGVGHLVVVDPDRLDHTNYPRVVGARPDDLRPWPGSGLLSRLLNRLPSYKVVIAERVARQANASIEYEAIVGDVTCVPGPGRACCLVC